MKRSYFLFVTLLLCSLNAMSQLYMEDDKEGLRVFLAQETDYLPAPNYVLMGLEPSDILNWDISEEWIEKLGDKVIWNDEWPKEIVSMNLVGGGLLNCSYFNKLSSLTVTGGIQFLNIELNSRLEYLNCSNNQLFALDVSANYQLKKLDCSHNQLGILNFQSSTMDSILEEVDCSYNNLQQLDLSALHSLYVLNCSYNRLESLTPIYRLRELNCANNQIGTLDLSSNSNLEIVDCSNNILSELITDYAGALKELYCYNNQLTNYTGNRGLRKLDCSRNQLTNLDLNICYSLQELNCSYNLLEFLNFQNNNGNCTLVSLNISNNKLKKVVWPTNSCGYLIGLVCENNALTFSTLSTDGVGAPFTYAPQANIEGGNIMANHLVDLSSEYDINGTTTQYSWHEVTGAPVTSIQMIEEGKFLMPDKYTDHTLTCEMTNSKYPDLVLYYNVNITPDTTVIKLRDHLILHNDLSTVNNYNHLVSKNQHFEIYAKTSVGNPNAVRFGLYNPANGALRDSLIVLSRSGDWYSCQLRSQTLNGNYMVMPYTYKDGERIDIERGENAIWVDKLPLKVNEPTGYSMRGIQEMAADNPNYATRYMQVNIGGKVNETLAIELETPFQVYMPTSIPANAEIGLFYPNGDFYTRISTSRNNYTYTCEIPFEVADDADYIIMPYMDLMITANKQIIERLEGSKLMDRLPLHVKSVWGDIWRSEIDAQSDVTSNMPDEVLFHIYPNPVKDILYVTGDSVQKIEIYTVAGSRIQEATNTNTIYMGDLSYGIYLVKVTTSAGTVTSKITKE